MAEQDSEQTAIYQRIAGALFDSLPAGWTSVEVTVSMIHFAARFECTCTTADGARQSVEAPDELWDEFTRLRELTYVPDRGAWLVAVFRLDHEGRFSVDFDYDRKPNLVAVTDDDYLEDLEKYPRAPELIPDWYPSGS